MKCRICNVKKVSNQFPSAVNAKAAPDNQFNLPDEQLIFACLQCLAKTDLLKKAKLARTIDDETFSIITSEIQELELSRKTDLNRFRGDQGSSNLLYITMLNGEAHEYLFNDETTVKDIKTFLGEKQARDPRSFRLMYNGIEIKVKNKENKLIKINEYGIEVGARIEAIVSLSQHAGKNNIDGLAKDKFGNAVGAESTLGLDGGFKGLNIAVINSCSEFNFENPRIALEKMGFQLHYWNWKKYPTAAELSEALTNSCQLWIISFYNPVYKPDVLAVIKQYHDRGGSLYLLGDNDPCNVAVNEVLAVIMPSIKLNGHDPGQKNVGMRVNNAGPGFEKHDIFTGIVILYEGFTIARFNGRDSRIKFIMYSSIGEPVLGICDDNLNNCGRIAIDVAFTRFFCSWTDAGQAAFVTNIASWLCCIDQDWL